MPDLLTSAFLGGLAGPERPTYKDPFAEEYLGKRATKTQREMWPEVRDTPGIYAGLIGGKGSAKTTFAAGYMLDRIQRYPGSKGYIAAATQQQAIESCAYQITKAANLMGINFYFKEFKIIDDLRHKAVYYFPDFQSSICIRSAENIDDIEGSEWDFAVIEEIQLWKSKEVAVAFARLRRGVGDHSRMVVGLPGDEEEWFYKFMDAGGFKYREIQTYENEQNLPPNYIRDLLAMFPGAEGLRYVNGQRVSLHSMPVQHAYSSEVHKNGPLSKKLCHYDPYRPLFISFDFNVAPCCVTLWQVKPHSFKVLREINGVWQNVRQVKEIMCQVDEFEGWRIGTEGVCSLIMDKYGDHTAGGVVVGDAAGNAADTRTVAKTDWTIITSSIGTIPEFVIRKGLVINKKKQGKRAARSGDAPLAKYSNPPLKDTIENLNRVLVDGDGHPGLLVLSESRFESGGAAASLQATKYKPDGTIDETPDKTAGREVKRTHHWATVRYAAWYLRPPGSRSVRSSNQRRGSTFEPEADRMY